MLEAGSAEASVCAEECDIGRLDVGKVEWRVADLFEESVSGWEGCGKEEMASCE